MSRCRAPRSLLFAAAFLVTAWFRLARTADWPLGGYAPCGGSPARTFATSELDSMMQLGGADIAYNDDDDLLWITSEDLIYKYRYSDGALLSSFSLEAINGGGFGSRRPRVFTILNILYHDARRRNHVVDNICRAFIYIYIYIYIYIRR